MCSFVASLGFININLTRATPSETKQQTVEPHKQRLAAETWGAAADEEAGLALSGGISDRTERTFGSAPSLILTLRPTTTSETTAIPMAETGVGNPSAPRTLPSTSFTRSKELCLQKSGTHSLEF